MTAEPRIFQAGQSKKATFSVASDYRYQKQGEWVSETSFFNVEAWRWVAEDVERLLHTGTPVIVTGRLVQNSWEDKESGAKRSTVLINAANVAIHLKGIGSMSPKTRGDSNASPAHEEPAAAPF